MREQENENSAGWLPEMSFQTVLSIVGIAFTAFELYQRFHPKTSSGVRINTEHNSTQNTISPRPEPKNSEALGDSGAGGEAGAKLGESQAPTRETPRSAASSKIGMV